MCWAILNFHFPFISFFLYKKIPDIYMSRVISTRIPPIVIHYYCTLDFLVHSIVHYSISLTIPKQSLAINFMVDIHSHQLVPPPWSFLYLTFSPTLFVQHSISHGYGPSSVTCHVFMDRLICINPHIHICKAL